MRAITIIAFIILSYTVNGQIIADHTVVDKYNNIPQRWIDSVKKMLVWIPGMSHGYGYLSGALLLEQYDSKFNVTTWLNTSAPAETDTTLRLGRLADAAEAFYTSASGIATYKTNIETAVNANNPYDIIGFGWSYQATFGNPPGGTIDPVYNIRWAGASSGGPEGSLRWGLDAGDRALTGNSVCMDTYIAAINEYIAYCETNEYPTKVIFTNGVVDDNEATESGFQREIKNQYLRDTCDNISDVIFFDYADILAYNNSDQLYTVNWNDGGTIRPHQQIHPDNMKDYDASWNVINRETHTPEDHIGEVGALRLGKALWWLLARVAGWDGLAETGYYEADYYVSTDGNDSNPGTYEEPWATWQKAFDTAEAGDTVYFRGGVWQPTSEPILNPSGGHGNSGTYSNPICFFNYPGEVPILDCSLYTSEVSKVALDVKNSTYLKFRGLTVRNCLQAVFNQWISGISFYDNGVIYLDRMTSTNIQGYGTWIIGFDTLYLTNCDSYNNYDADSDEPGNRADGFTIGSGTDTPDADNIAYIYGCRSWENSDDGFEISPSCQLDVHDNWSWGNGRGTHGAGQGFKYRHGYLQTTSTRKTYKNIAAYNRGAGFIEQNLSANYGPIMSYYNNTVYECWTGFESDPHVTGFDCATDDADAVYRNNLVYSSYYSPAFDQSYLSACNYTYPTYVTIDHCTWELNANSPFWQYNTDVTVTNDDFVSLDTTGMSGARGINGALPTTNFLRIIEGSDLIDAGTNVGLAYAGASPDIGYFEVGLLDEIKIIKYDGNIVKHNGKIIIIR